MSVNSIGGTASQIAPHNQQPVARGVKKPGDGDTKEITMITTHCDKAHAKHDASCESTISTRPDPQSGEPGSLVDKSV